MYLDGAEQSENGALVYHGRFESCPRSKMVARGCERRLQVCVPCQELWEQRKLLEEQQRERHEKERLDALRKKDKHEESAVASSEVKQKLQGFLLNKKQREAVALANGASLSPVPLSPSSSASTLTQQSQQSPTLVPGHQFRNWYVDGNALVEFRNDELSEVQDHSLERTEGASS